jgi:hypothetical protein
MMKYVLACLAASAVLATATPAQPLPKLSEFLTSCYRDATTCRGKIRDFVTTADAQHVICRPQDISVNQSISDILAWLRSDSTHPDALNEEPFDEGLAQATDALYRCREAAAPAAPAEPAAPAAPAAPAEPAAPAAQPAS